MTETIESTFELSTDNKTLTITPKEIKDNYLYTVTVSGLKDSTGAAMPAVEVSYQTPYSPMYCTLESLKVVVDTFGIPDENLLMYIRQASKEADYIAGGTAKAEDYATQEFVRTKATYDCLTRAFMDRAYSGGGSTYTLDTATYQDSLNSTAFKELLNRLGKALQKWQDAIRGYFNEGRVKPKATRMGLKSSQNSEVAWTTVDTISQDINRSMPQWS